MFVASLVVLLKILLGSPPAYINNHVLSGWLYLLSVIISMSVYVAIKRCKLKGSYSLVLSVAGFVLAGFFSGFPQKPLWILSVSSLIVLVLVSTLKDKADQNTPEKTIKIKLPW